MPSTQPGVSHGGPRPRQMASRILPHQGFLVCFMVHGMSPTTPRLNYSANGSSSRTPARFSYTRPPRPCRPTPSTPSTSVQRQSMARPATTRNVSSPDTCVRPCRMRFFSFFLFYLSTKNFPGLFLSLFYRLLFSLNENEFCSIIYLWAPLKEH
ncbi:hypothetical protein B0H13DRAFT_89947 [Mycena leptocephala]|nr:hypothetical protein B0H13DRAFT_89947 [Mycena leptocephala]